MDINKVKKIFRKASTLDKINQYLVNSRNRPRTWKSKFGHNPSTLGSICERKIYYSYFKLEEDNPPTADGIKTMEVGNHMEIMLMEWLKAIGEHIPYRNKTDGQIRKGYDGKEDPQFLISSAKWRIGRGKIDNVARDSEGLWIHEIKSVNDRKFKALKKGPIPQHLIQNSIYLQCFNDMYLSGEFDHIPEVKGGGKASGIKMFYVNRDSGAIKEFIFSITELTQLILDIDRKIVRQNKYIDAFELPQKNPDMCNYCPFKTKCDSDWNDIKNYVDGLMGNGTL